MVLRAVRYLQLVFVTVMAAAFLSVMPAFADDQAQAYAGDGPQALLYDDGTLVLQLGSEPDASMGSLVSSYQGVDQGSLRSVLGEDRLSVKSVIIKDRIAYPLCTGYFAGLSACESIDGLANLDVSGVESVSRMFKGCESLVSLDLSGLAMPNIVLASNLFDGCTSLQSISVAGFFMPAVQDVSYMFRGCTSLESVDLAFLEGAKPVAANEMFDGCSALKSVDFASFDTSSCTTMLRMFRDCASLSALDLASFNTSRVADMSWMFSGCVSLNELNLASFTTSTGTAMGFMFNNCPMLSVVSLGKGFVFADNCELPCPDPGFIAGANGLWYSASGKSYQPSKVPSGKADTYYAARSQVPGGVPARIERVAGDYANQTSALISSKTFTQSDWVVLARDDDFADAMSATGLAGALECPIILTNRYSLSPAAADEIKRLGATKAYVIGGKGAIPANLERELRSLGCQVKQRVFGNYASDTSVACAKLIAKHGGGNDAIIAMGGNFQDALSISSFAYAYKLPIFLATVSGDRSLPAAAISTIKGMKGDIWVPGGPGAVPVATVEKVFKGRTVHRIYGYDGYETSNAIAQFMVSSGLLSADTCVVACGAQGPKGSDALSGAALAGMVKAPMLLVNGNKALGRVDYTTIDAGVEGGEPAFLKSNRDSVTQVWVLGGTYVMPDKSISRIKAALRSA